MFGMFARRERAPAARVLAQVGLFLLVLMLAGLAAVSAEAQTVCTVTASASRSDANVSGSGQLNLLRVPASGGSTVFKYAGEADPESLAYACPTSTLTGSPRFTGSIVNGAGTNNRALLTTGWTFTFDDGSELTRPTGSTYIYFTPAPGQASKTLSGSGVLSTGGSAQSQYAAGQTYAGAFDIAQGTATTGRDTNNTYSVVVTVAPPPAITTVSPSSGPTAGGNNVVISGSGFSASGNTVQFGGTTGAIVAESANAITVTAPARAAGVVNVVVTIADGQTATATNGYTYLQAPTITAASPTSGPVAGGASVVIQGTGFTGATAVAFGGSPATSFVVNSATQITAVSPAGSAGAVSVSVTTPGGTATLSAGHTYVAAPAVTAVSPSAGPTAGGATVVITGTNLSNTTSVTFGATAATGFVVNSATQITATSPANAAGAYDIRVTTAGGTSATSASDQYTYVAAPTVSSVSPASGSTAGGSTVTITGTGFAAANLTGAVRFGAANATYTINSNTQITATSPANSAGTYDITVTTPGGVSATSAADQFTYVPTPTVTAVSPSSGSTAGGASVVITGSNFSTATAVSFGGTAAAGFVINSNTQITATTPARAAGSVNVSVTTSGGTGTLAGGYAFVAPPVASSQTYGSIIAYNDGANAVTSLDLNAYLTGGGAPTSFAVGSATTAQGGTVSVNSAGTVSYTPPVGYRNANDSFTWTATNAGGTSSAATVTVTIGNPTLSVSLPSATATAGAAYNPGGAAIIVNGGRPSYTINNVGGLPAGLTQANGVISGAPSATGVFTITVDVTDSSLGAGPYTATATASLTVSAPAAPVVSPFTTAPIAYNPGPATATVFSLAGQATNNPTGYQVGASSNGATVSVDSAGLVSYTPPVGFRGDDTFNYVATNAGGTSNVGQVTVPVNNPVFSGSLPAATGMVGAVYNPGGLVVTVSGGNAPYSNFSATGLPAGLTMDGAGVITGVPTTATNATVVITVTDSSTGLGGYTSTFSASLDIAAPTIILSPAAGALPAAQAGIAYSQTITSSGGVSPITYTLGAGALPPGLSFSNGAISGTPTSTGTYNFTVTATDSSGNGYAGSAAYSLTVAAPAITITPVSLPSGGVNVAYSQTITAEGGVAPYTFSLDSGALPNGLSFTAGGILSGTPTEAGAFPLTVRATDTTAGGTYFGTQSYTLNIGLGSQSISFGALSDASLSASPLTLSASASSGLTVSFVSETSSVCTVSGTSVTLLQTGACTIRAEQAGDATWSAAPPVSRSFSVTPANLGLVVGAPSATTVGAAFSQANAATGGVAPYIYELNAGALPSGVNLNSSTGLVSGVPTTAGAFSYQVRVVDSQSTPVVTVGSTVTGTMAKGSQTISFISTAPAATVPGPTYVVAATASSGLTVSFSLDPSSTACTLSGQTVSFVAVGACVINANQAGDANWNAATQVQQSFAVTASPPVAADLNGVTVAFNSVGAAIDLSGSITGGAHTSIAIVTGPAHGVVSVNGDVVSYTPSAGYFGPDSFTFTAVGQGGTSNVATVSLTVATPAPPTASDRIGVAVPYNGSGTPIDLSASVTGLYSSLAVATSPSHGTVTVSGAVATYTPAANYYGADSFTFTATGPGGTSSPATVSITVANPPAPTVSSLSGVAVGFNSTGAPIDLAPSVAGVYTTLAIGAPPANGTVTLNGTTATYVPVAGYFGPDSFTFTATGPGGSSAPATVSLTVAAPPPPVVTPPGDPVVVTPPAGGGSQPVVVSLGASTTGVVDDVRVGAAAQNGTATIGGEGTPANPWTLVYTPAANFMGTDTVSVIASGPGGDSAPAVFTFQVLGKAPDLSASTASNASVTVSPTAGLVGGPFNAVRITRAPAFGTAAVNGLDIVFTPGAANGGATSLDYVIDLPFGTSAAGRIDLVSNLVPGAQALTAETLQGVPVTVRLSNTAGGPFTGASVTAISPAAAGSATIAGSGGNWDLTFTPSSTFSGDVVVSFNLTNAVGSSSGTLTVAVEARPDPSLNVEVRGVATAQVTSARRFADTQINNFQRRLQMLHDGTNGSSNGLGLNLGFGGRGDLDNDPREALRRELGGRDDVDPGAIGDRSREMLGLDLWAGRNAGSEATSATEGRLGALSSLADRRDDRSVIGFWTAGSVDWGRQDADGQRDYRFTTQGVTVGLDARVTDNLIVGGGLGYGEDKTKIGDNGSVSNGSALTGALYASWRPAENFYLDGVIGYVDLDFDARRWVSGLAGQPDGYAMSERSGDVRFASAAFGRLLRQNGMTTDVYARVDAREITLNGFTETGGGYGALIWDDVEQSSLSANFGASWRWVMESHRYGRITPSARLEWSHELEDIGAQGVRYVDWAASPTYLVPLDAWSRNAINLDLGAEWSLTDRMMFSLGYRGNFGDASTSHGGELRITYGW